MNTISGRTKVSMPKNVKIVLYFVVCLLSLSASCLLYSIIFFNDYADAFIASHPDSFQGDISTSISRKIVLGALLLRLVVALTWIASFFYLKKFLIENEKYRIPTMLGYGFISLAGFAYLSLHAELHVLAVIRIVQVIVALVMILFLLVDLFRLRTRK